MTNQTTSPVVLTILDGWGYSEKVHGNAIKQAKTPTMDYLWKNYPHTLLSASGQSVGLPKNQMGNSEVGHTTIGSGRIINQDLVRIDKSIENKQFFQNKTIHDTCRIIKENNSKLHIIGLCSNGGVHSHIKHLKALVELVVEYKNEVCLHLITDGRDTAPKIAISFLNEIQELIKNFSNVKICTISGRYYSMDRDCRWSRTEKFYKILTEDNSTYNKKDLNYTEIIKTYYQDEISDEFIPPTRIKPGKISDNDGIIFFNFRPDRIRQLLHCLAKENFKGFTTKKLVNLTLTTFTEYDSSLNIPQAFPAEYKKNFLGEIISNAGLKQLRLAETEKYAHVTYFFNGGAEEPFPGEDRELIPSPKVETYDLKPQMSAYEITNSLINAINKNIYDIIIVNYANPDMIGHTGNMKATRQAIEVIDNCINKIIDTVKEKKGTLVITADHGNADLMLDKENKPCKSHSTNLVPFIVMETKNDIFINKLKKHGSLADIAPTILNILELKAPAEMDGKSLVSEHKIKSLIKN
uniref:2,3-bisphosphoglycerate-independent phosphoglycerate mutase n=1 Tax=Platysiphonia delicata TaxID=2006979 RepID=A0A1Z1M194_9FLOR|nr:phosphoglycerate mutase [Platysiphonia delicata]ARW59533.1 phosphoglycerate mutase [Platysiphonia delicata]